MTEATTLPEANRPKMPPIPGASPQAREKGRALAAIHQHYLREMSQVAAVLQRVRAGDAPPDHLKQIVLATDMRQNLHAVGTICGHQCQVLMMHHNIEEGHMFPGLEAAGNAALQSIVAQLKAEHEVIHAQITALANASDALAHTPTEPHFDQVQQCFERLYHSVRSHFGYEETELAEAIGHYLDGI